MRGKLQKNPYCQALSISLSLNLSLSLRDRDRADTIITFHTTPHHTTPQTSLNPNTDRGVH